MFDTLLVVAAKVFQDSISGREDVELLDFSLKRNPPPSPLLSSRPTPLATPPTTGADNQPPLSSPHTKEMEEKRQELLEQLQEADEEQKLQEKKEKQQLEQLQKQQQQEELLQEKRKEKQPTVPKRKRQLVLPSIDQEALPMKPNTFEFLFFHTNRYVLEVCYRIRLSKTVFRRTGWKERWLLQSHYGLEEERKPIARLLPKQNKHTRCF